MGIKKINRKEFEELYKNSSIKEMSKELGVSSTTIYKIIKDMNIPKKGKKERWRKIIVEE